MPKPCLIVSTCGTSLLTNNADSGLPALLTRFANRSKPEDVPTEPRQRIQQHLDARREEFTQETDLQRLMELSAELNGLIRFYGGNLSAARDQHVLLATDTWLGESTARIVADALERHGHLVEVKRVRDLRTDDPASFRWAMSDLVAWCAETLKGYRDAGHRVVFNLTGGFKSVQGFMQALGMIYADESVYVFERTEQLLRLPRLPVQLDSKAILRRHLAVFRRIAASLLVREAEVAGVPESLVNTLDGQAVFSPWGELVWQEAYRAVYSAELLEPITPKLALGPRFQQTLDGLTPDRLRHINEHLDQLARRLEDGKTYNPRSLDFKPLQGTGHKGSTHECDAWADEDAKRLFGHFEGGRYIIDRLDKGLH
ncbi:MAG: putative CRISPR-associated protein [Candidatus Competibacteraceae bacterium]|nr:putative CRISPR-associated protein [Candidatus Competibacteraceae bacterium]MCP5133576.1 putative CRISPR-associated protein [Gammaproteobacteria bacterium]